MPTSESFEHAGRIAAAAVRVAAPPARIWSSWAEPAHLSQWFTDRAIGEAKPGGTMTWIFDRFGSRFPYEVLVAEPERRLVLRGAPPGRAPFLLEIALTPEGEATRVEIRNSGFGREPAGEEEYEGVVSGWRMTLALLREYAERHFGEPKQSFFAMQPAPFAYDRILPYFRSEERLALWLTTSGSVGEEGSDCSLVLWGGAVLTGRVLAVTSREAALSWEEIRGVVELKSFNLSPLTRAVCVRGCGWGLDEVRAEAVERMMTQAVERLAAALHGLEGPARRSS